MAWAVSSARSHSPAPANASATAAIANGRRWESGTLRATWPASSSRRTACSRSASIIALPTQASALALESAAVSSRAVRSARSHRPASARAPATPASALGWECMGMLLAIASPRRRWPTRTSRAGSSTGRCSLRPSRRSRWTASRPRVARSGSGCSSARSCVVVISAIASPSPSVAASSRSCRRGSVARSTSRRRSPWPLSASSVQYGRSRYCGVSAGQPRSR